MTSAGRNGGPIPRDPDLPTGLRVYVLLGGRTGEHHASVTSGLTVWENLDRARYDVVAVGITREGRWLLVDDPLELLEKGEEVREGVPVEASGDGLLEALVPARGRIEKAGVAGPNGGKREADPSMVFFPMLPGKYGEDGSIQGAFEMADVPYVGSGVLASAVAMDKAASKALFLQAGLPVVPYQVVLRSGWERDRYSVLQAIEDDLGWPVFVKPANSGSSLGVTKAWDRAGLMTGLDQASEWDRKLLVETAVDAREIELAVLGNDDPVVSGPGEVVPGAEFYSYHDKHIDDRAKEIIPAPLTSKQTRRAQELALGAFRALDCSGMGRVDLLLDRGTGLFSVSEINTLPGMRRKSMYPRLLEAMGYSFSGVLDRLIELAFDRWRDRKRIRVSVGDGT